METRRVVILFQFPLVGRAIEQLLKSTDNIEVIACMPDESEGWTRTLELRPDVVIQVCEAGAASVAPAQLLSKDVLRLIRLEATRNQMGLYQAQQMTVTCPEDLIRAIQASGEWVGNP